MTTCVERIATVFKDDLVHRVALVLLVLVLVLDGGL